MPPIVPLSPDKLIQAATEQARHQSGAGRPKHALLRRAVSTSYYALYHCIGLEAAETLLPAGTRDQKLSIVRAFGHRQIKDCTGWIAGRQGGVPNPAKPLVAALKSSPFLTVSDAFWDLQEARHKADYDHFAVFSKATTLGLVQDAQRAIQDVRAAGGSDRQSFFTLVAMQSSLR